MLKAFEAIPDDEDAIGSFLKKELKGNERTYRNLFKYGRIKSIHQTAKPPLGSILRDEEGHIHGFLGCIAHRAQKYDNKWMINMSCWAVSPDARAHSLKLLNHFLSRENSIFTNFSASEQVQQILPRFGFELIDEAELKYSTIWPAIMGSIQYIFAPKNAENLDKLERKIVDDHLDMGTIKISPHPKRTYVFLKKNEQILNSLQLMHATNATREDLTTDWPFLCFWALFKHAAHTIITDKRLPPLKIRFYEEKHRKMFIKNLNAEEPIPYRAYSEPLHILGKFR